MPTCIWSFILAVQVVYVVDAIWHSPRSLCKLGERASVCRLLVTPSPTVSTSTLGRRRLWQTILQWHVCRSRKFQLLSDTHL